MVSAIVIKESVLIFPAESSGNLFYFLIEFALALKDFIGERVKEDVSQFGFLAAALIKITVRGNEHGRAAATLLRPETVSDRSAFLFDTAGNVTDSGIAFAVAAVTVRRGVAGELFNDLGADRVMPRVLGQVALNDTKVSHLCQLDCNALFLSVGND